MTEKWYGLIISPVDDFRSFKILHAESSGCKSTLMCEKNSYYVDNLWNQYYEHLKLRGKNGWRVFNSHLPENTEAKQHPQNY